MAHKVTVIFELREEVSPDLFLSKVAVAASRGLLRPGETLRLKGDDIVYTITDEMTELLPGIEVPKVTVSTL